MMASQLFCSKHNINKYFDWWYPWEWCLMESQNILLAFNIGPCEMWQYFQSIIFKHIHLYRLVAQTQLSVKLFSCECHQASLIRSPYWFRYWLGAVRQQAINWANADPDLCCHVVLLGHNELTLAMQGLNHRRQAKSVSWLLMPCLIASPGHQQLWVWTCFVGLGRRGRISTTCAISLWRDNVNANTIYQWLSARLKYL